MFVNNSSTQFDFNYISKYAFQFIPESGTTPSPSQPAGPGGERFCITY